MWNWWKECRREKLCSQLVSQLLAAAREAGLPARDCHSVQDLLLAREYGVAFDIIVGQLYEHELEIPTSLFALAKQAAESMLLTPGSYFYLSELVRSADHVPIPVRKELAQLLNSLQLARK